MEHIALFAIGLVLLAAGAACLVVGAARLDRATGRNAFAVGVVAVSFGPCVAGLAFDLAAVLHRFPRLALGNVIGGNIAGIGLVLGVAALVRPVAATAKVLSPTVTLVIAATLLFWFLARDNRIERVEAGVLLVVGVGALVFLIRATRREPEAVKAEFAAWVPDRMPVWAAGVLALAGLGSLIGGAALVVTEAIEATRVSRIDSHRLGLISAVGTSLPALAAAVLATRRGRSDLVLGIVVGPALFNLLFVVGIVAMVSPLLVIEIAILNEIPAMALFALLLIPAMLNGKVPRWEGAILLAAYAGFMAWQVTKK